MPPDDRVVDFVVQHLAFLDGDGAEPDLDALRDSERDEAFQLLRVLDAFAPEPVEMPPLDQDPIALRLGFVRPRPEHGMG